MLYHTLNVRLAYTLALIVFVSSRHIQKSEIGKVQQDISKSGKPGEYLWYKTGSVQTDQKFAKSVIARSSHGKKAHSLDENEESSGSTFPNEEDDPSGSGEVHEEYMSGSGIYPNSYMVDIQESDTTDSSAREAVDKMIQVSSGEDSPEETSADFSGDSKGEVERNETPEKELNAQDGSGSTDDEQENDNDEDSQKEEKEEPKVKVMSPAVLKGGEVQRKRSDIYKKSKVTEGNSESEYDKLFKDFKNDGDLGPEVEEDDDSYLDDAITDEEARQLVSEENKEETGMSKSDILGRHHYKGEDIGSMFEGYTDKSGSNSDESGASSGEHKKKAYAHNMKEILSKLDKDVFRGNNSEEHKQLHSKQHRHYHKQLHKHHHHHHHHKHQNNSFTEEADASRALSHHADSGIFNGSVSNVTMEAQKVKKHHEHKRHHHHHHHHHNRLHHHHHQLDHHLKEMESHHDNFNESQIPIADVQQSNSNTQYSTQYPSVYYPSSGPIINTVTPQSPQAPQGTYSAEESSLLQYYNQPSNGFVYHAVRDADKIGAVCLDGSTPGYYVRQGSAEAGKNWIIYLQGGAWCESEKACSGRSRMHLGSSLFFKPLGNPGGILSNSAKENPEFHDWNVAYLPYCDGSSFSGNRSDPVEFEGSLLYFRGFRILDSTISELLSDTSLKEARNVVFSGTSAGGLAVMLHADYVRSKLPKHAHFRSLADSGFFLDTTSRKHKKQKKFRKAMQNVFKLHDCTDGVPQECVKKMSGKDLWKCIFPQYFLRFVKSRLFVVNSLYDSWQLSHIWEIPCASTPYKCSKKEVKLIKKFRSKTLKAMKPVFASSNIGLYVDSCIDHGQVISNAQWNSIKVQHKSIASSFATWCQKPTKTEFFIDEDDYPANPTCVTKDVARRSEIITEGF